MKDGSKTSPPRGQELAELDEARPELLEAQAQAPAEDLPPVGPGLELGLDVLAGLGEGEVRDRGDDPPRDELVEAVLGEGDDDLPQAGDVADGLGDFPSGLDEIHARVLFPDCRTSPPLLKTAPAGRVPNFPGEVQKGPPACYGGAHEGHPDLRHPLGRPRGGRPQAARGPLPPAPPGQVVRRGARDRGGRRCWWPAPSPGRAAGGRCCWRGRRSSRRTSSWGRSSGAPGGAGRRGGAPPRGRSRRGGPSGRLLPLRGILGARPGAARRPGGGVRRLRLPRALLPDVPLPRRLGLQPVPGAPGPAGAGQGEGQLLRLLQAGGGRRRGGSGKGRPGLGGQGALSRTRDGEQPHHGGGAAGDPGGSSSTSVGTERERIKRTIAEARELGDLKENAEYHAAKEKQALIEGRIARLQSIASSAQVVDTSRMTGPTIVFGAKVTLLNLETGEKQSCRIVGKDESDTSRGRGLPDQPPGQGADGQGGGGRGGRQGPPGGHRVPDRGGRVPLAAVPAPRPAW